MSLKEGYVATTRTALYAYQKIKLEKKGGFDYKEWVS
jgi:hypothetical protein